MLKISETKNFLTFHLFSSCCASLKSILKQFKKDGNFNFRMISLFLSYTCLDKNVSKMCLLLIKCDQTFLFKIFLFKMCLSDVFPFSLHRVQEFYARSFNPLSLVNVFTYTEKGQRFGEIFKTKFSFYTCTSFP